MDCTKVSLFLSEYVDDQLDPTSKRLVDEHLASCETCAADLASLRAYLRAMASMEKIKAPQDFLAAVYERIEPPSVSERIIRWLFYPLRIKLPMELAGIVVATLLLVFAYQQAPRQESEEVLPSLPAEVRQSVGSTDKKGASLDQMTVGRPAEVPKRIQLSLSLHPSKLLGDTAKLRALEAQPATPGKAEPADAEHHALRQSSPKPAASKESVPSASVTGARDNESLAPRGPSEVYGFIKESAGSMGGALVSVEYHQATNEPKTIIVRIPADKYSLFLKRLGQAGQINETGEVRSEGPKAADGSELLEARIDLIQPE